MAEVEVKILEVDVEAVTAKLVELGAEKVFEGDIQASMYDFPDRRLKERDSFLRLRSKGDSVELVFKRKLSVGIAKSYEEHEVGVSDRASAERILESLGMEVVKRRKPKRRVSYAIGKAHFELDTLEGFPTYLEIEVPDESEIEKWVTALGLSMADAKPWLEKHVYEHYGVEG